MNNGHWYKLGRQGYKTFSLWWAQKISLEISHEILEKYNQVKEIDFDVSNFKNFVDGFNTPEEKTMSVVFYIMFVVGGIANALGGLSQILPLSRKLNPNLKPHLSYYRIIPQYRNIKNTFWYIWNEFMRKKPNILKIFRFLFGNLDTEPWSNWYLLLFYRLMTCVT